jgi:hypothetical protein
MCHPPFADSCQCIILLVLFTPRMPSGYDASSCQAGMLCWPQVECIWQAPAALAARPGPNSTGCPYCPSAPASRAAQQTQHHVLLPTGWSVHRRLSPAHSPVYRSKDALSVTRSATVIDVLRNRCRCQCDAPAVPTARPALQARANATKRLRIADSQPTFIAFRRGRAHDVTMRTFHVRASQAC